MKQGLVSVRGQLGWLARARPAKHTEAIVDSFAEKSGPRFEGDPAALLASLGDDTERARVAEQLRNKVKKCPVCSKPNAHTLAT